MSFNLCANVGANTGSIACDKTRGVPIKIIVGSKTFSSADYADQASFKAAFLGAIKQAKSSGSKLFPFPEIQEWANKSEANKEGSLAGGFKQVLIEGKPAYEYQVIVSQSLAKKLRAFNGSEVRVFTYDNQGLVWGNIDSNGLYQGDRAMIWVTAPGFGLADKPVTATISLSYLSSTEFHDQSGYVPASFSAGDIKGLLDVDLTLAQAMAANVAKVKGQIATSQAGVKLDIYPDYSVSIGSATVWQATRKDTGVAVPITSVAIDAALSAWTVTLDTSAWTALPVGTKVGLSLKDPATLDAANITGIESVELILTK